MVAIARVRQHAPEADVAAFMRDARIHQRDMRYPELFRAPRQQRARASTGIPVFRRERVHQEGASGLIVTALRHGSLHVRQQRSLSMFRLEQCVLCGWYDPALVLQHELAFDPAFEVLAADAVHLVVGTPDGAILSYFCMEPASAQDGSPAGGHHGGRALNDGARVPAWTVADGDRPVFPTERDLFGPGVFATLPPLAQTRIARIREIGYLMRNQAVTPTTRVATLAIVEAMSAIGQLVVNASPPLDAVVGHMDLEARRLTYELDVPVLYAPHVPILTMSMATDSLWARDIDLPGRFWPFVMTAEDLRGYPEWVTWLDTVLDKPMNQAIRELLERRRGPRQHPPVAFAQPLEPPGVPHSSSVGSAHGNGDRNGAAAAYAWTPDPGLPTPASTDEREGRAATTTWPRRTAGGSRPVQTRIRG